MKKSYSLSKKDIEELITSYFLTKGEKVSSCDFKTISCGDRYGDSYQVFSEVVVYITEEKKR